MPALSLCPRRLGLLLALCLGLPGVTDARAAGPTKKGAPSVPSAGAKKNKPPKKTTKTKKKPTKREHARRPNPAQAPAIERRSVLGERRFDRLPTFGSVDGVAVRKEHLGERMALQNFKLKYVSPRQGRLRGVGVEPVRPGVRYDFSNADSTFRYEASSGWQLLKAPATVRHVTATCGMRSICEVDVNVPVDHTPVLAGFALRFTRHVEIQAISIVPENTDYAVQVKSPSGAEYTVDLYLAILPDDVVVATERLSATRTGDSRSAQVPQIDMYNPTPGTGRLLQGFSVSMTDGAHPVAELSITGVGNSGPAHVVFQDVTGDRPMKASLLWALVR